MSGFKTHLYGGIVAGAVTSVCYIIKEPSMFSLTQFFGIFLAGTIGGLIPDLDSDTSKPFSMLFTFLSMIVPVLFFKEIAMGWLYITTIIDPLLKYLSSSVFPLVFPSVFPAKLSQFPNIHQVTPEFIITYFVIAYLFIRYGICKLIKSMTIHRGIMHSIPFAILCAEGGFLIFIPSGKNMAIAIGISIFAGCVTHLLLDEFNSITFRSGFIPKFKRSAGTAFKFKSKSIIDTLIVYILVIIGYLQVVKDLVKQSTFK